jgi:polar amino acid transport system substrate-binding protein
MKKPVIVPGEVKRSSLLKKLSAMSIAITLLGCSQAIAEQTVRLVGDPWPPYVIGELGEDATSGVAVEIVDEIFALIDDASARFPLIPWKRALREVEEGQSDGIGLLLKTAERERYMLYTVPLVTGEGLIWSATAGTANAFEWTSIQDLQGLKIGITQGYSYGEEFDRMFEKGELITVSAPSVELLFSMLANGRVELALANDAVGYSLARKYPEAGIVPAKRSTLSETFYMGISRKSSAVKLVPEINHAIELLRTNGTIARIVRRE